MCPYLFGLTPFYILGRSPYNFFIAILENYRQQNFWNKLTFMDPTTNSEAMNSEFLIFKQSDLLVGKILST